MPTAGERYTLSSSVVGNLQERRVQLNGAERLLARTTSRLDFRAKRVDGDGRSMSSAIRAVAGHDSASTLLLNRATVASSVLNALPSS